MVGAEEVKEDKIRLEANDVNVGDLLDGGSVPVWDSSLVDVVLVVEVVEVVIEVVVVSSSSLSSSSLTFSAS